MRLLFLHLSDLHLEKRTDVDNKKIDEICSVISPNCIGTIDAIIVLITGDIAFSGKPVEYNCFIDFKEKLLTSLKTKVEKVYLYHVPGNHDIDFSYISKPDDRINYEDWFRASGNFNESKLNLTEETKARRAYLNLARENQPSLQSPLFSRYILGLDDFPIEINLINTTFFSLKTNNDQGLHFLPDSAINQLGESSGAKMAITLLHHSHQWFNDNCKRNFERVLLEKNTMIFCGHEHFSATQEISYNGISPARVFCGGCLCDRGNWDNSEFFICTYDTEQSVFEQYQCRWSPQGDIYNVQKVDNGFLAHKYSVDGPKKFNDAHIASLIEDSHIHISGKLADYYVFPGLRRENSESDEDYFEINDFGRLFQIIEERRHLEISGGYSSGKSALLKMIFQYYLPQKYVLLCRFEDIVSGNRNRIIKNVYESIYGDDRIEYEKFMRADRENKVILIDDIHLIRPKHVGSFLEKIEDDFGYVIYTTNNLLKLDFEERIKSVIAKDSYSCYRMLPLLQDKRKELVEKIVPLKYPALLENEQIAMVDRICHALDLQRRYIPLTPEIILQFIEHYANYQTESVQNDGSIFGKVFESSITNILGPHLSGKISVDKAMVLLGKIAFYIHTNRSYPISTPEIVAIIDEYCDNYGDKINSVNFITMAVDSRILMEYGQSEKYKFCNNNYLAYFIASEICANGDTESVRKCLEYACFGINSTILMFVTYLTNETKLIDIILEAALNVSSEWEEFSFGTQDFKHLEVQATVKIPLVPTEEEKEENQKIDKDTDRAEVENGKLDVVTIYDYNEEEIGKLENKLIRSLSLLTLVARCLPNFEHRLLKKQKEKIVKALYEIPNKIFFAWAKETERCYDSLVEFILNVETNEFTRKIRTKDDAKRFLQWNSISLLLEFYYSTITNACRMNTFDYLTDMANGVVDFSKETHQLERLIVLGQSKKIDSFISDSDSFRENSNSAAAQLALSCIIHNVLLREKLTTRQIKRIESKFASEKRHAETLYRRRIESKQNS